MGPVIASFISHYFGYVLTMGAFAALIFIIGTIAICQLPAHIDTVVEVSTEKEEFKKTQVIDVPYKAFFKNRRTLMGISCHFVAALSYVFYDPILSPALAMESNVKTDLCPYFFALMSICYAIGCVVMGKLSGMVEKRVLISISFFLISASILVSGGLLMDSITATAIGLAGAGFFYSGCLLPPIPEVINTMQADLDRKEEKKRRLLQESDEDMMLKFNRLN